MQRTLRLGQWSLAVLGTGIHYTGVCHLFRCSAKQINLNHTTSELMNSLKVTAFLD